MGEQTANLGNKASALHALFSAERMRISDLVCAPTDWFSHPIAPVSRFSITSLPLVVRGNARRARGWNWIDPRFPLIQVTRTLVSLWRDQGTIFDLIKARCRSPDISKQIAIATGRLPKAQTCLQNVVKFVEFRFVAFGRPGQG